MDSVLRGLHCQDVRTELGHCRTKRRCLVVLSDIERFSPFFSVRESLCERGGTEPQRGHC